MSPMRRMMNTKALKFENLAYEGGGGCSQGNAALGFHPAFLDTETFSIHLSRFADGSLAPFHLLDGLPEEVVVARSIFGRVVAAKPSLVSGFERKGFFYTRAAAARAVAEWSSPE